MINLMLQSVLKSGQAQAFKCSIAAAAVHNNENHFVTNRKKQQLF